MIDSQSLSSSTTKSSSKPSPTTIASDSSSEIETKCDTNISPRRLITHLFNRWFSHRTNLRGGRHSIQTIMSNKIATVIHQSTTQTVSSSGSEKRASRSISQRANTTSKVGCGRNLYSTSSTTKSGSSSEEKPQYISGEYKSTQQVQPHPRRGGNTDMRRINQG